ncbi:hypothetical protein ABZ845_29630 [Streptomyces sp. NPDC047022]|uniref:SCO2400 family protein n=1 Tax=Streptomyces sp. NPDC047022 TaxID=3155737 RepID=UPI0033FC013F
MDYCSSCRRHLNGALVCPGCGAYAPDIAPVDISGPAYSAPAPRAPRGTAVSAALEWELSAPEATLHEKAAAWDGPDDDPQDASLPGLPLGAAQGRAARRRQRARWKRIQRRAVVATAFALVGGGLTFGVLDRNTGDQAQAAPAPDIASMGGTDYAAPENPDPSSTQGGVSGSADASSTSSSAAGLPHHGASAPSHGATPSAVQPDSAAVPRAMTATVGASRPRSTTSSSNSLVTVPSHTSPTTAPSSAPTAAPTPSASTNPGTPPANPAPTATSPSHLCLLVVCLG